MVKNRALKRDARVIKASTGITYPRARDLLTDPVDQDTLVPSLFLGYGADGGNIIHRPGKGTVLVIGGYSGSGKSVLMRRLAAEAADVASVYVIDVAKGGADYRDIRGELSALETTADSALARVRDLTENRTAASVLFVDYIDYTTSPEGIPGFREALQALSDSGMPVIVGGQLPHRALPAPLMARADRVLIGKAASAHRQALLREPDALIISDKYQAVFESAAGSVLVVLPPGGQATAAPYQFELGTNAAGHSVAFVPSQDLNLYVTGPVASGKTTILNALAADASTSMDVYFANAAFPSSEIQTPQTVRKMTTHQETADVLEELLQEISARRTACHEAGVGSVADLPEPPRKILIVLDEFQWLLHTEQLSVFSDPELRPLRARIAVALGKIARESRSAGVSLVMASQTDEVLRLIPGESQLRTSLSWLSLGDPGRGYHHGSEIRLLHPLELGRQEGIYQPQSRRGAYVDITSF
jgi:Ni2+-binding GTPase involved in maturation of urease and hydrogenase